MFKKMRLFTLLILFITVIAGCSSDDKIKIGISGSDTTIWDFVAEKAKEAGIEIEIVRFSDYVQPNITLGEGGIDSKAFQTISDVDCFIEEDDFDLVLISTTFVSPVVRYNNNDV